MKTPSYELGIQLGRNLVEFMAKLDHDGAVRLNENFDLVYGIASGEIKRTTPALLKLFASGVSTPEVPAVKVADCFKVGDGVFAYRDSDFDRFLPKMVPAVGVGNASTFELKKELNLREMVQAYLGTKGSLDELQKVLIKQGKCWSPEQIDNLIRKCEAGDNPLALRTDCYANIFFMDIGNVVFAVNAYRGSVGWGVSVLEFAHTNRWIVGYRVSFRN